MKIIILILIIIKIKINPKADLLLLQVSKKKLNIQNGTKINN